MRSSALSTLVALTLALAACGTHEGGSQPLAASATASALAASAPKSDSAKKFAVEAIGSQVSFMMEAPEEKIRGKADGTATGSLFIDPKDLTKTTGNVAVDLAGLELFQRKKAEPAPEGDDKKDEKKKKDGEEKAPEVPADGFATEVKTEAQNQHARAWLEIDESSPEADRKKNQRVEFAIRSIDEVSEKDVSKLSGPERTVTVKATGDFLLHQRMSKKTVELEVTFFYEGDEAKRVRVKTKAPLGIGLAEHDVRPREAFGKLAQKTLDAMGSKVAKQAMVELDVIATLGDAPTGQTTPAAAAPAADASAAPAADASAAPAADASAAPAADASAAPAAPPATSAAPVAP